MKLAVWPFYSQQDKRTGQFLLGTCGAAKQLSWLAARIEDELGWEVSVAVPKRTQDVAPFRRSVPVYIPASNPLQQVHWDTRTLGTFFADADVALLNHELLSIPVRALFPKLRIAQMCSVSPEPEDLFQAAWDCADLVVAQGETARNYIDKRTWRKVVAWRLAFDADEPVLQYSHKTIDVLFVQRCSVTNYTHHKEFLAALPLMQDLRVAFTDVTGYLRKERPDLNYTTPRTYVEVLSSSRVAVALNDNLYGGLSIREACRAGCTPLVLDALCYIELCGNPYLHMLRRDQLTPERIAEACRRAITEPKLVDVSGESYQASWPKVKQDLQELVK